MDSWALNSHATIAQKAGRSEEALESFDEAIVDIEGKPANARPVKQGMMQELLTGKKLYV